GGGDVDEAAAAAARVGTHGRHGVDGAPVDALHVDGVDLVELGLAHFQHGAVAVRPAGVVDHHVQAPAEVLRGLHQTRPVVAARDVGGDVARLPTGRHDVGGDFFAQGRLDVVDDHHRPLDRQPRAMPSPMPPPAPVT